MSGLELATLQRLTGLDRAGGNARAVPRVDGDAIPVQFNPATLRISRRNNVDRGGVTAQTQKRQHPSQESSSLSFDLEFDTAEQGGGGEYVDVRRWTALIRQFVEPPPERPKDPPPAVRFAWGTLIYDGIIEEVTEELDHFAPDGTPLRAKVAVSIREQNFQYEANQQGPGSRDARAAIDPGGSAATPTGSAPGSSGTRQPQRIVRAHAGESVQETLTREGLDPAAWRGAMRGLDGPLTLAAGTSVQVGAEVSGGAGIGRSDGFAAGPAPTSEAALAVALGGTAAGPRPSPRAAGFALSAAGGVAAAVTAVASADAARGRAQASASFDVPSAPRPEGEVDPRALTYGRSIPLRTRPVPAADAAPSQRAGDARLGTLRGRPGGRCP